MTPVAQFPINLVIPVTSDEEGKIIEKLIADAAITNAFLSKAHYENPDESQRARLMINGEAVVKGSVEQMKEAFRIQAGMSQKSNLAVQEWQKPASDKPAVFVTIQSRLVRSC